MVQHDTVMLRQYY